MLEYPEVITIKKQLEKEVLGKQIMSVSPPNKVHKFCWFNGEATEYEQKIKGSKISSVDSFGIYVEISFDNGYKLCINDGVNVRLLTENKIPKTYQMIFHLNDNQVLVFTVAMYGGIVLHHGNYDNDYYLKSLSYISIFSKDFPQYYQKILSESKPNLSAKAFLATEQRFPGIGNGVAQDILFTAKIHPKRKVSSLSEEEKDNLFNCIISVITDMTNLGGRDTEKDLYGNSGRYITKMSKNSVKNPCPVCGSELKKETYLGGSIYYCPNCQKLQ